MQSKPGNIGAFLVICILSASLLVGQDAVECLGSIMSKLGGTLSIQLDGPARIDAGSMVSVYKFFTKEIFGMKTSGWLHAADGKLVSLYGTTATVKITEEKSKMMVNGKKVDHLQKGVKVKLVRK